MPAFEYFCKPDPSCVPLLSQDELATVLVRAHQNFNLTWDFWCSHLYADIYPAALGTFGISSEGMNLADMEKALEHAGTGRKEGNLYFCFTKPESRRECITAYNPQFSGKSAFFGIEPDGSFSMNSDIENKGIKVLEALGKAMVDISHEHTDAVPKLMCYVVADI